MSKLPAWAYLLRVHITRLPARLFRTAVIAGRDSAALMRASWRVGKRCAPAAHNGVGARQIAEALTDRLSSKRTHQRESLVWSSK